MTNIIKVKVRNPEFGRPGVWMFEQPEFFLYQGEEVNLKWVNADQLAMTTNNPEWPVRVIARKNIISINDQPVSQDSGIKTFKVAGSNGAEYTVSVNNGKMTCSCSGFQFRRTCKHIKSV